MTEREAELLRVLRRLRDAVYAHHAARYTNDDKRWWMVLQERDLALEDADEAIKRAEGWEKV